MPNKIGNTSEVLKSSSDWLNSTGLPEDMCVALFNVVPGNKRCSGAKPTNGIRKTSCFQL